MPTRRSMADGGGRSNIVDWNSSEHDLRDTAPLKCMLNCILFALDIKSTVCKSVLPDSLSLDPGQQASATEGVHAPGRTEASDLPSVASHIFATGLDMEDEDRLVAIRSTVSALQKVRYLNRKCAI